MKDSLNVKGKIIAILDTPTGRELYETHNLVTNEGDKYYAQKGAGEATTYAFGSLVLGTGSTAPSKTSTYASITPIDLTEKAIYSGYPKTNDSDTDNTGAGVDIITYKYYYTKSEFTANGINEGIVVVPDASGTDPVLTHFQFASSFNKTANDTLTVFVNHEFTGA